METEKYIPALRFNWLTAVYDPVVRLTTREKIFKTALIEQARLKPQQRVLDLACGTATLAVLIKKTQPQAEVIGIDGDAKILAIAKRKTETANLEVEFDEGMSFELPYPDQWFDRVFSSLFFHHLTRENKVRTLREVRRVLKPGGELHVADWGKPHNLLMKIASRGIELLDGGETTADNFKGLLPSFIGGSGFRKVTETLHFNSLFGTIRLLKATK